MLNEAENSAKSVKISSETQDNWAEMQINISYAQTNIICKVRKPGNSILGRFDQQCANNNL